MVAPVRTLVTLAVVLAGCAGLDETVAPERLATLQGSLQLPAGAGGNAWVFLYLPGEGFPSTPVAPRYATAVSAERVSRGAPRYLFLPLEPNPFRLWGLLDGDGNFDPQVDVLAQPGAADWVATGQAVNLQPGKLSDVPLEVGTRIRSEPPAFHVDTQETVLVLDGDPRAPSSFVVLSDDAGGKLNLKQGGFRIGLADPDGDGRPQDNDGDGAPDLTLTFVLRLKPLPGQLAPDAQVVVPLAFDPTAFLQELGGRVGLSVRADRLQLTVVPVAQELTPGKQGKTVRTALTAIPRGDYELVVLADGGQFWRVPNALADSLPSQGTRFRFDRVR